MLNILRKRAQSTLIQFLVLIIALVFVFWGVGSNLGTKRNALATVNGYEIPYEDYKRTYDNAVDNLRVQFGGSIPKGFLEGLGMQKQVLQQLIMAALLRQGGSDMGIHVSKVSTRDEIKKMDVFQVGGQFDINRYKQILSQNRMTPVTFETGLQNDLLAQKVTDAIHSFAAVSYNEVHARIGFDNEQVKLAYAEIKSADFEDKVVVDEDQLKEWFEKQKNNYLTEPQVRLKYLSFNYDDDLKQVSIPEEKVKEQFERDIQKYTSPEQRHARHILFRVNETDDAQVRAEKKNKAEEVLELVKNSGDFAELAKQYSEGPTGPNGGDLGFFNKGSMVEKFDEAVFQMQPGYVSEIVETVFGYHIIKLEAIRPAGVKSFEDVKEEISEALQQQGVNEITKDRARKAYEGIIRSGSLENYKKQTGSDVLETDYFARSSPPESLAGDPKFIQVAFKLKKGELSSLVQLKEGYAIIFVDDIKAPEVPDISIVREKVVTDYTKSMSVELAKGAAEKSLKESIENQSLTVEGLSDDVKQSDYITRTNIAQAGEVPTQVLQEAFNLSLQDSFPQEPLNMGESFYIFKVTERRQGADNTAEDQQAQIQEQLKLIAQNRLLENWLAWMESSADIWINEQILQ